jgi:serine/threonine-protein kinase
MHSEPDPPVHDDDDGTWFQPASTGNAAGPQEAPIPRTEAASGDHGSRLLNPDAEVPTNNPTEAPTGRLTEGLTGLAAQANGADGANSFPTADFTGASAATGSDPGSGSGEGESRESGDWDASPPPVIASGQVVFGKYHLLEMIGEGGMGQVWKVRHVELDSRRALKLIKPEIAKNAEGWKRFRREARVMDRLGQHPNSVAIYDFKRVQSMAYIEMAFVRGQSLDKILKENGDRPMPLPWIVSVLRQLCSVLQDAHSHVDEATGRPKPIVHRDLKPSNLMLVDNKPDGQNLKVLDFGIAKMVDDKGAEDERTMELTGPAVFVGTAGYASPEQIRGDKEIDGRSDLYSTGVMLYQFLTGELPFHGSRMAMLAAHMMRAPAPMTETSSKPDIPPAIEEVVHRCLAKDPDARYQTAAELFDAFSKAAGAQGEQNDREPTRKQSRKPENKRSLWPIAAAALLVIGLAGGGAAYLLSSTRKKLPEVTTDIHGPGTGGATSIPEVVVPPPPPPPKKTLPDGYEAVVESGFDRDEYPKMLFRTADGIRFHRIAPDKLAYLAEGYEPESPGFGGDWPEVIVRSGTQGKVRFRRVSERTYLRGDPQAVRPDGDKNIAVNDPIDDQEQNPLVPHLVSVSAFYIQETEVTNGEIEDYLRDKPSENKAKFNKWKLSRDKILESVKDPKIARLFPATCISYETAREYAHAQNGRLPTEAEWEFAAKSEDEKRLYSWGMEPPNADDPKAHLYNGRDWMPVQVKSYPKDKTEQGVFDMGGNVKEWCLDAYRPYTEMLAENEQPIKDDHQKVRSSPANGKEPKFVVRGGSVNTDPTEAHVFRRDAQLASTELPDLGFRIVITCPKLDLTKSAGNR